MTIGLEALSGVDASQFAGLVKLPAQLPTVSHQHSSNARTSISDMPGTSFADWIVRGVEEVNQGLVQGQTAMQAVALGKTDNLHSVMIQLEQSRLQLMTLMQFRSRMLEAYQELMRMQM